MDRGSCEGDKVKTIPKEKKWKKANVCLRRPYKHLRKEEKLTAKEKRKDIPILMQSCKEQQAEKRKPSSTINAKKQGKTIE